MNIHGPHYRRSSQTLYSLHQGKGNLGSDTVEFEILDPIKVGDGHNAQVFNIRIRSVPPNSKTLQGGTELVAKVYDPLYQNDDGGYLNPFLCMDKYYTHEVHAYHVLSCLQGGLIPRFYGSYSLDIPCYGTDNGPETRAVRLILIEHIPGLSMLETDPNQFPQADRQQIMNAIFNRKPDEPRIAHLDLFLGQYISPLIRWNERRMFEFEELVDWEWDSWLESEYAHTADTITPAMRALYCPEGV
ncbi:hypothetical protein BO94DRAFT_568278 [Aspergillus sclerotioniger CBS 115572]|uniref:Protein kinase domain-containing protein n=1 Tax=Aspergillus sclerotioniger CBS 115572 TaxID=1450535 RepID=A0A317VSL1_9EURO|nr:hypothetical protein BO94DRAFT_568278 [Aspergillus sclerotioniger CBS 115572]PWY77313.1 hypothetical protein BO94DRAFT_568278 [Aspergillus sclerotioniger CBS 115572]